jgi:hypothetical protein
LSPPRILHFTGPGGVGTTTIAAATAVRCADRAGTSGDRTLLLSTDGGGAVEDALDTALGSAPTPVADGLWAARLGARGAGEPDLHALVHEGGWQTVVVDGPARGLPGGAAASIRLVVTAEARVLGAARRLAIAAALDGCPLDLVVVNRLLPEPGAEGVLGERRQAEQAHLTGLEARCAPAPVLRVGLASGDLVGPDALRPIGIECYGSADPGSIGADAPGLRITRGEGGYDLVLAIPFVARGDVDLARQGHELVISVGDGTRRLDLPDSLRRRGVTSARFEDGRLHVHFADPR